MKKETKNIIYISINQRRKIQANQGFLKKKKENDRLKSQSDLEEKKIRSAPDLISLLTRQKDYQVFDLSMIDRFAMKQLAYREATPVSERWSARLRLLDRLESPRKYRCPILINQPGVPFPGFINRGPRFVEADTTKYTSNDDSSIHFLPYDTIKRKGFTRPTHEAGLNRRYRFAIKIHVFKAVLFLFFFNGFEIAIPIHDIEVS